MAKRLIRLAFFPVIFLGILAAAITIWLTERDEAFINAFKESWETFYD